MAGTKVKQTLSHLLERFRNGDIPQAVAMSVFPPSDIPATNWSLLNRTIMVINGTHDARGFNQWQKAGRKVKKGAKGFYILAPKMKKVELEAETDEEREKYVLAGFTPIAVFRAEDTEGAPLEYEQIELPDLPLMDLAHQWGLEIKGIPGNSIVLGYFRENSEIALASPEETVFFHELAHAAHSRLKGSISTEKKWKKEVVAELSASVLCQLYGKSDRYVGNNYQYIENYAHDAKMSAYMACVNVLKETEQVLDLIVNWNTEHSAYSENV